MSRVSVAMVVGYVSTLVFLSIGLSLAYAFLGTEAVFQPESFRPSGLWTSVLFGVGFVAAAFGAIIAGRTAPGTKAPLMLADVVFVLGLLLVIPAMMATGDQSVPRTGDLSLIEAFMQGRQPVWVALINPMVQKVGVYFGAWLIFRGTGLPT